MSRELRYERVIQASPTRVFDLFTSPAGQREVYLVGRKSGRRFAVPVAFTRYDGALLVGTPFGWARNLRTGEPVEIRLHGKRRTAVEVVTDQAGVVDGHTITARDNHAFAGFNKIRIDDAREPNPDDLHLPWAAGALVFRLVPQ